MATCSKQRTKSSTSSPLLFQNPTVSKESSQAFVRKLVAMAISNVTYLRGIFPESVYADRELEGLQLKILRGSESCPAACQLVQWISGAFDALKKNYLRKIILGVHEEGAQADDVLETYTFTFTYLGDKLDTCHVVQGGKSSKKTLAVCTDPKAVLRCAMEMLRGTLYLVRTLDPLPANIMLSMKLLYYDEVTPEHYEPPGFKPAQNTEYNFESGPLSAKVGEVSTPYHSLMFICKTDSAKFDAIKKLYDNSAESMAVDKQTTNDEDIFSQLTQLQEQSQAEKPDEHSIDEYIPASQVSTAPLQMSAKSAKPVNNVAVPGNSPEPPGSEVSAVVDASSSDEMQPTKCVCGGDKEGGTMVSCCVCHSWSHAACYGFEAESKIPETFVCLQCHDESKGKVCGDTKLLYLQPAQQQLVCLYRRALVLCQEMSRVSAATLSRELDIDRSVANEVIEHLVADGILKSAKIKGSSRVVNREMLQNIMVQYFGSTATFGLDPRNDVESSIKGIEEMQLTPPTNRKSSRSLYKTNSSPMEDDTPPGKRRKLSRADMGVVNRHH